MRVSLLLVTCLCVGCGSNELRDSDVAGQWERQYSKWLEGLETTGRPKFTIDFMPDGSYLEADSTGQRFGRYRQYGSNRLMIYHQDGDSAVIEYRMLGKDTMKVVAVGRSDTIRLVRKP